MLGRLIVPLEERRRDGCALVESAALRSRGGDWLRRLVRPGFVLLRRVPGLCRRVPEYRYRALGAARAVPDITVVTMKPTKYDPEILTVFPPSSGPVAGATERTTGVGASPLISLATHTATQQRGSPDRSIPADADERRPARQGR
jgi:hypothetical protein